MIEIDIQKVHRGWAIAELSPGDQIDYRIVSSNGTEVESYTSIKTFLDIHMCACSEIRSEESPAATAFSLQEDTSSVTLRIAEKTFETTYGDLCAASKDALETIFQELDENSDVGERTQAMASMNAARDWIDIERLYEEILS